MKKSVKYGLYFAAGLVAVLLLASIVYFLPCSRLLTGSGKSIL